MTHHKGSDWKKPGATRKRKAKEEGLSLKAWLNEKLAAARSHALECELDLEFLLDLYQRQEGRCSVTGIVMTTRRFDVCAISIDRVDSLVGYRKNNVALVCQWVNLGRGASCSHEEFRAMLDSWGADWVCPHNIEWVEEFLNWSTQS